MELKKVKSAKNNEFKLNEFLKITTNIHSSVSKMNICYSIIMPKQYCIKKIYNNFSNPEKVKTLCFDRNNPFYFA